MSSVTSTPRPRGRHPLVYAQTEMLARSSQPLEPVGRRGRGLWCGAPASATVAVAAGGAAVRPLLDKLGPETARRQAIEREIEALDALDGAADFTSAAVRRALLRQASQVRVALLAHRDEARDVLRAFVPAITFTPYGTGRARGYHFAATGTYGALLGETPRPNGVPDGGTSLAHFSFGRIFCSELTRR